MFNASKKITLDLIIKKVVNIYIVYEINLWQYKLLILYWLNAVKLVKKMVILVRIIIMGMVLDLIHMDIFHCQVIW